MPRVRRRLYHQAMEGILERIGYKYEKLRLGGILIRKNRRKLYVEVAGKNLPYLVRYGEEAFPWETHLQLSRLDRIEEEAAGWGAESWIAFCYVILKGHYEEHFSTIVTLDGMRFGAKLIRTSHFRSNMRPRSPSWQAVDLPRESVIELTCDLENV